MTGSLQHAVIMVGYLYFKTGLQLQILNDIHPFQFKANVLHQDDAHVRFYIIAFINPNASEWFFSFKFLWGKISGQFRLCSPFIHARLEGAD